MKTFGFRVQASAVWKPAEPDFHLLSGAGWTDICFCPHILWMGQFKRRGPHIRDRFFLFRIKVPLKKCAGQWFEHLTVLNCVSCDSSCGCFYDLRPQPPTNVAQIQAVNGWSLVSLNRLLQQLKQPSAAVCSVAEVMWLPNLKPYLKFLLRNKSPLVLYTVYSRHRFLRIHQCTHL